MSLLDTLTKSLVDVYSNKLSQQEQADLMEALEFVINEEKYKKFYQLFPDTGPFRRELYKKHLEFFAAGARYRERGFIAGNRIGKEQPYSAKILTPTGFTTMGAITVGDTLCTPTGTTATVVEVFEQGEKDIYKLTFDDGSTTTCGLDHLWKCKGSEERFRKISSRYGQWQIKSFREIKAKFDKNPTSTKNRFSFPIVDTLNFTEPTLPIDPYTLGVLLGDGSMTSSCSIHTNDPEILDLIVLPDDCAFSHIQVQQRTSCREYGIKGLVPYLRDLNLYGQTCYNKHIPEMYFNSNRRLELLQGLMDTDGCVSGSVTEFVSVSEQLAKGVVRLCYSLGIKCSLKEKKTSWVYCGERRYSSAWRVCIWYTDKPLFKLSRKLNKQKLNGQYKNGKERVLISIEYSHRELAKCILLDDEDHLYITDDYIITHNTEAGAFETVCHATGLYPDWWEGKRFTKPTLIWVGGDTATTCRDIIQDKLLGPITEQGSGMLPKDSIIETKSRRNVPDAIETIRVKHITGGTSTIVIKTYEQGRASWQGTAVDFIWIDEECPQEVYGEALIRTMTTGGSTILTFTPLSGLTELVSNFLDNSQDSDCKFPKYVCTVSWDDVPHITQEAKEEMLASTPPALRAARSKGEPTVGSGRIYPVDIDTIITEDFKIPKHWQKAYAFDVGWHNSAVAFGAFDRDNDILYIYSEHKQGEVEPVIHAQAIKARGEWLKGVIDPAARGRSQIDGQNLYELYKKLGLKIYPAQNAVEAGIYEVWSRLTSGRLKIFSSCTALLKELVLYHRDEKGKIVKKNDHILDCLRYLCMSINTLGIWQYPQDPFKQKQVVDIKAYMTACM